MLSYLQSSKVNLEMRITWMIVSNMISRNEPVLNVLQCKQVEAATMTISRQFWRKKSHEKVMSLFWRLLLLVLLLLALQTSMGLSQCNNSPPFTQYSASSSSHQATYIVQNAVFPSFPESSARSVYCSQPLDDLFHCSPTVHSDDVTIAAPELWWRW